LLHLLKTGPSNYNYRNYKGVLISLPVEKLMYDNAYLRMT